LIPSYQLPRLCDVACKMGTVTEQRRTQSWNSIWAQVFPVQAINTNIRHIIDSQTQQFITLYYYGLHVSTPWSHPQDLHWT
jgi:hypothetical protein